MRRRGGGLWSILCGEGSRVGARDSRRSRKAIRLHRSTSQPGVCPSGGQRSEASMPSSSTMIGTDRSPRSVSSTERSRNSFSTRSSWCTSAVNLRCCGVRKVVPRQDGQPSATSANIGHVVAGFGNVVSVSFARCRCQTLLPPAPHIMRSPKLLRLKLLRSEAGARPNRSLFPRRREA